VRALRFIAVASALAGIVMLASSGLGTRAELWDFRTGLSLLRNAAYVGIAAMVLSLIALFVRRPRGGALALLLASLVLAVVTVAVPRGFTRKAQSVPPIHDITTDTVDPPAFVDVLPLRADAPNSAVYAGDSIAELQRAAYPDIEPVMLDDAPPEAFRRALAAAAQMGWDIVARDSAEGRIEATATTTWFGFKDDVVIRVRAAAAGSRLDLRSVSRVGRSDVGANAARIRAYTKAL